MLNFELVQRKDSIELIILTKLEGMNSINLEKILENDIMIKPVSSIGINLTAVTYIDSKGLGVLVRAIQLCQNNTKKLFLFGLSHEIQNIFHFARLEKVFNIIDYKLYKELYPL